MRNAGNFVPPYNPKADEAESMEFTLLSNSDERKETTMDRFQILPHLVALGAAYALALPIGWDREREERSAGLRTFPLVAIASCGFIQAAEALLVNSPDGMARIVEGVITGIGFIGGGAILKTGAAVHGTATAASLWATGAVGAAVALGVYDVAIVIAGGTFLTLRLITPLKQEGVAAAAPIKENARWP
jgi:putative Mg2+ transporter-C (MgtC) family protein